MKLPKTYTSAVDIWIVCLLALPVLFLIGNGIFLITTADPKTGLKLICFGLFIVLLIFLIGIPCKYTLDNKSIVIRSGIFKHTIGLKRIQNLSLTYNPLSAPAFSIKRVKIKLDKGFRLVSPKNREEFINDVTKILKEVHNKKLQ